MSDPAAGPAPDLGRASITNLRLATAASVVTFVVNGMFIGVWGGSLPGLRAKLDLNDGHVAILLFCVGAAGAIAMQFAGRIAERIGAKIPTYAGAAVQIALLVAIAYSPTMGWTVVFAIVFGIGNGVMDVCMNALAVEIEQARSRPIMSRIHGSWSIGALLGSFSVVAFRGVSSDVAARVPYPIVTVAVVGAVTLAWAWRSAHDVRPDTVDASGAPVVRARLPRSVWLLAAMALCFGITEGTAVDWSSLHVTDVAGVDESTGAMGLVAVSALMFIVRMLGDFAAERLGRRRVVQLAAVIASVGYTLTTLFTSLPLVLAAWALVGFGVGLIAPNIYGLAGHLGGPRMLAAVTSAGYTAFLSGPALIGWVSHHVGLQRAMLVPLITAFGLVLMSLRMPEVTGAASNPDK